MHFAVIVGLIVAFGTGDSSSKSNHKASSEAGKSDATVQLAVPKPQLQHVAVLFRHTVRAPRVFPPNDSLLRPELFPRGVERSTREGLIATRNATLEWRGWYKDFLEGQSTSFTSVIDLFDLLSFYCLLSLVSEEATAARFV